MKKLKRTYTRCAGLTALVLLALLIAGSFADLPISRFLYPGHESSFGQFFAAFGELPAFALLASCGVLLIVRRGEFRPELHMILLAFGVCLIAGSVFLSIHEATDNVPALPTPGKRAQSRRERILLSYGRYCSPSFRRPRLCPGFYDRARLYLLCAAFYDSKRCRYRRHELCRDGCHDV